MVIGAAEVTTAVVVGVTTLSSVVIFAFVVCPAGNLDYSRPRRYFWLIAVGGCCHFNKDLHHKVRRTTLSGCGPGSSPQLLPPALCLATTVTLPTPVATATDFRRHQQPWPVTAWTTKINCLIWLLLHQAQAQLQP